MEAFGLSVPKGTFVGDDVYSSASDGQEITIYSQNREAARTAAERIFGPSVNYRQSIAAAKRSGSSVDRIAEYIVSRSGSPAKLGAIRYLQNFLGSIKLRSFIEVLHEDGNRELIIEASEENKQRVVHLRATAANAEQGEDDIFPAHDLLPRIQALF